MKLLLVDIVVMKKSLLFIYQLPDLTSHGDLLSLSELNNKYNRPTKDYDESQSSSRPTPPTLAAVNQLLTHSKGSTLDMTRLPKPVDIAGNFTNLTQTVWDNPYEKKLNKWIENNKIKINEISSIDNNSLSRLAATKRNDEVITS